MLTIENAGGLAGLPAQPGQAVMVEIEIKAHVMCAGQKCKPGDVLEVDETTARFMLNTKKAMPFVGKATKPATRKPKTTTRSKKK